MAACTDCGGHVDYANDPDAKWRHQAQTGHAPDAEQPLHRIAYLAGESYVDHDGYAVVMIERGQAGFVVAATRPTLTAAIAMATSLNDYLGLTVDDTDDILASVRAATWPTPRPAPLLAGHAGDPR